MGDASMDYVSIGQRAVEEGLAHTIARLAAKDTSVYACVVTARELGLTENQTAALIIVILHRGLKEMERRMLTTLAESKR